jgi:hypothetical protein
LSEQSENKMIVVQANRHSAISAATHVWILGTKVIIIHFRCRRKKWS